MNLWLHSLVGPLHVCCFAKCQDKSPGFLSISLFPSEGKNISSGNKAWAKKKKGDMTRMQEITCKWTILVFEPSPFIPSAFVLLLPFMTPLIRCASVLLPGPPRAPLFVCQLDAAPCAPSFHTFPALPFPLEGFFAFFSCAFWTFLCWTWFSGVSCCCFFS